ncbi:MAG: helix-turn-helix transcriptional regulator, partial [Bacteroidales bacterium]|nr:helix-turn-helix transcriptional regulator [Bacteroidales bacterium]
MLKFDKHLNILFKFMIAELQKIDFDEEGGFRAEFISETGGFWHFHPEYELDLHTKSNGTRIVGDSVELFDRYDMILLAGNIPHCWNYYRPEGDLPEKHGVVLHFKLTSLGEPFISQPEMSKVRELLSEASRGILFSQEDARKAEPHLNNMIRNKGIDKLIDFFNVLKILINAKQREFLCTENYRLEYDERGNKKLTDVYNYIRENYNKPISLETISGVAGMNPFSFSKYFKENT